MHGVETHVHGPEKQYKRFKLLITFEIGRCKDKMSPYICYYKEGDKPPQLKLEIMMNLTLETKNEARQGDVTNAYNIAMEMTNIVDFTASLSKNIGSSKIGNGGNHIWIQDTITGERLAIITNLIN